jgi:hypothetical protein
VLVPVDVCGNALAILGFANASCVGGAIALLVTTILIRAPPVRYPPRTGTR